MMSSEALMHHKAIADEKTENVDDANTAGVSDVSYRRKLR